MSQLIWQIVKGGNAFTVKDKQNGANLSRDPGNPTNENRCVRAWVRPVGGFGAVIGCSLVCWR